MTTITELIAGSPELVQLLTLNRNDNGAAVTLSPALPQPFTAGSGDAFNFTFTDPSGDCAMGYSFTFLISITGVTISDPFYSGSTTVAGTSAGGPAPVSLPLSKWQVIVPPVSTPVVWQDASNQLRLRTDVDADYVNLIIAAATDFAQDSLEMSLMPQTLAAVFNIDDFGRRTATFGPVYDARHTAVKLPRGPVQSIISVADAAGNAITGYTLERAACADRLRLTDTTTKFPIIVTYVAGFPSANAIPAGIRMAILTHVATLYIERESANANGAMAVPHSLEAFYALKRRGIGVA